MSNQTGIDYYDLLVSRIHGGVCAFQSLRAHRRERTHDNAPPPMARTAPSPPAAYSDAASDERPGPVVLEPQGFIAHGGRVLPLFGDLRAASIGTEAPPTTTASQPTTAAPRTTPPPTPEAVQLLVQEAPSHSPSVALALKLPLPTPPSRLGLMYGHAPIPATDAPASAPQHATSPASRPPVSGGPPASPEAVDPREPSAAPRSPAESDPAGRCLEAVLAGRARDEAARLEQVHAEHRACLATVLSEHRTELHAQAEADAARATQLIRELLAEHRAELARAADAQTGRLALVLSQHRDELEAMQPDRPEVAPDRSLPDEELRAALIEQARLQREAHDDLTQHIAGLTTIVADLGQTVGLLAVAAYDDRRSRVPTVSLPPPPRVVATVSAVANTTIQTLGVSSAATSPVPAASSAIPMESASGEPRPDAANVSAVADALATPEIGLQSTLGASRPDVCKPARAWPTSDAQDHARVSKDVGEMVDDDEDWSDVPDPDDVPVFGRLSPVTPLAPCDPKGHAHV